MLLLISDPLTYAMVFMLLVGLPAPLCKYAAARCEQCWWWVIQFKGGKQVSSSWQFQLCRVVLFYLSHANKFPTELSNSILCGYVELLGETR